MNEDTYTKCTKCGRPMHYCKGKCGCKPQGCHCKEYGPVVCGGIRQTEPKCPYTAVIPSMVVEHADNLKDLCDTFVHVSDINTTFYIDDKHRTIITWAGPVEYDNYDLATNSLGLRSQFLIDFANNRGAYYDKTGNYQIFNFGNTSPAATTIYIALSFPETTEWRSTGDDGLNIDYDPFAVAGSKIGTRFVPSVQYRNLSYGDGGPFWYTDEEVFDMLERGDDVVFFHVPINWAGAGLYNSSVTEPVSKVDWLRMTAYQERAIEVSPDVFAEITTYSGVAYTAGLPLAYGMNRVVNGDTTEYSFFTQGVDTYRGVN